MLSTLTLHVLRKGHNVDKIHRALWLGSMGRTTRNERYHAEVKLSVWQVTVQTGEAIASICNYS